MKAKFYLESYEHLYRRAEQLLEQIAALDAKATGTGSIRYDKDRVKSSNQSDIYSIVDRKVQLESVAQHLQLEMQDIEHGIREAVSDLSDKDKKIAFLTWLDFEGSIYISQLLHVSRQTVFRRRKMIEIKVQEYLDNTLKH